jgi:parvulin-like peptidyl-prolyl isomerase
MEFTPDDDFNKEVKKFEQWLTQDKQPTQEEVIEELQGWLAQDQEEEQHIDMSDDDINLLSEDEKTALIKSQAQLISKLQDTIDWYEADEEEAGHE